ncbi:MAG: terminase small subunit [bacterium]|nr:terminase small subunit [bacterium]
MVFQKKYTAKQLQERADEYFAATPREEQSVTGLALALDTSRQSLCNWEKDEDLGHIVKLAKTRIEHAYELIGVERGRAFDIFRLKNMGWKDKYENDTHLSGDTDFLTALRESGRARG